MKLKEKLGSAMVVVRPTRTAPVLISGLDESTTVEELSTDLAKRDPEPATEQAMFPVPRNWAPSSRISGRIPFQLLPQV